MKENGNIKVHTENIFPIIKKWLYSDKDIFLRELVSNSCDAISKLNKLTSLNEAPKTDEGFMIKVILDKPNKIIKVIDNGIGMTSDEVKKYINQVAFSGAEEFIKKYKEEKTDESKIIGHFGLGFYSAFMVSDEVTIDTLSYIEGSTAVLWKCNGGTEYEMQDGERKERGTTITLKISDDSKEFLEEAKLSEILNKYCAFLPYEIYLEDTENKKEEEIKPINDTKPLWTKNPKECTHEEYLNFYRKVFFDFNEPLFYIHLNVEYPFNLQGILYFPKLKNEFANMEGQIKLFNNQVFVADNIKEVIPEFLLLLKGVIDCKDLPLNVSRSFLQNDGYVKKVSAHITKKVSDKLTELFDKEKENFYKYWDDINPFVKFGCLRDEKFFERVKDIIIFKKTDGEYVTLKELKEQNSDKIYYVSDEKQQAHYINMFKNQGINAVLLTNVIDNHFSSFLEMKENIKFTRVDSEISDNLKNEDKTHNKEEIEKIFKENLAIEGLKIEATHLNDENTPAVILLSEQSRRMQEMSKMFGYGNFGEAFKAEHTLIINTNNPLILKLSENLEALDKKQICEHIYDLAMLSHKPLEAEQMSKFIKRSNDILIKIIG